jgi:hypothetical protein
MYTKSNISPRRESILTGARLGGGIGLGALGASGIAGGALYEPEDEMVILSL